jgi:tungstate transport system ATP-binding protein
MERPVMHGCAPDTILPLELCEVVYAPGGKRLIDGVSCRLESGLKTAIVGPNGAGKSLLLRLCHGLIRPTAGEVIWHGAAGRDPALAQAMVFQRPVMLRRSGAANIDYALSLRSLDRELRRQRVAEVLERTGLADIADRPARVLSGGEQQKLALARAWALRPQVLFLDEPTSSLDPAAAHAIEEIIQALHAEGTRIVMTTHDLGQARRLADEVIFLHHGRIVEHSPAPVFFENPASPLAAAFLRGELLWRE